LVGRIARGVVFLVVGSIAEAVFEIDAEVLDRLPCQLLDDARVEARGDRWLEFERGGERVCVWRVLLQRAQREGAEFARQAGAEQVGAAIERMDRLALGRIARILR